MTLREIIEVATLLGVFVMALQMIILVFIAGRAIIKIKKAILPLFTEENFNKVLKIIQELKPPTAAEHDEDDLYQIEMVRPLIVNDKLAAWYLVQENILYIWTAPGENEGQLIDRLAQRPEEKFTLCAYLNLSRTDRKTLKIKYNLP